MSSDKTNSIKTGDRRNFLKQSALSAAGVMIVPRYVLGGKGYVAPSDRLNLAAIGAGGKGYSDIRNAWNNGENVVAICDIDKNRATKAIETWPKANFYYDFRALLEKEKIDAVTIATPDHTHTVAAMMAMQMGIHVYVQKPLTHNISEARMLAKAARKYKIVTQMGNQGASNPSLELMKKWFSDGLIGTVSEVHVWTDRPVWPQGIPLPKDKPAFPDHISPEHWDLFIGPAEYMDYHPLFHPFKWRGWWNFGTGALGDMGCHLIDPAYRILGLGYPTEVECSVGQVFLKDWVPEYNPEGCPPSARVQLKFPGSKENRSEVSLTWYDGGMRPFHPEWIPADEPMGEPDSSNGMMLIGEKGIITCGIYGRYPQLFRPKEPKLTMPKNEEEVQLPQLPEYGHPYAWVKAVKAGYKSKESKALTSSFDYAGPLTETVLMGNLAIRSYQSGSYNSEGKLIFEGRKKLLWNGKKMRITNYEKANEFVSRNYRDDWKIDF